MIVDHLGPFLRDRRERLDPVGLGLEKGRRRTPGLRREEVAQRANVSPTWYTWLEQGRGGRPSAKALNRLADALVLEPAEREHLFTLASQRPDNQIYPTKDRISTRLQNLLDTLESSPAYVKNLTTHLIGWNHAAAIILDDYVNAARNGISILEYVFRDPGAHHRTNDWEQDCRFAVAAFRLQASKGGHDERAAHLVEELCLEDLGFRKLWAKSEVMSYGEGNRQVIHPEAGPLEFEYSTFSVNGQPNMMLVIYTPASRDDLCRVRQLISDKSLISKM